MIKTVKELDERYASCKACLEAKINSTDGKKHLIVCGGTGCLSTHQRYLVLYQLSSLDILFH